MCIRDSDYPPHGLIYLKFISIMKSNQDRYFNCLEHCHHHEQFETPKRICLATLTDDPFDNPKVSIDQT